MKFLSPGEHDTITLRLRKTSLSSTGELVFNNYLAEIVEYTNAAGRKDQEAIPVNLIEDAKAEEGVENTLNRAIYRLPQADPLDVERDEAMPEKIIITKPHRV